MSYTNEAVNLFFCCVFHQIVLPIALLLKRANKLNPKLGRSIYAHTVKVGFENDVTVVELLLMFMKK